MQLVEAKAPRIIGNEAVRLVKENFRIEAYDSGSGVTKWPPRKASTNNRYDKRTGVKGSVFNSDKKLLDQTGNLKDSIHYELKPKGVLIGSDLTIIPYAQIHNEGGNGMAWGRVPFKMPERKYMPAPNEPPNPKMLKAITAKIDYEIRGAMKAFIP
jgi:phage gpG-like protein